MSKHLLRKLLNLDTVDQETNNTSNDNDNKKYATYYSTDGGRNVLTKIPKHMNISTQSLPEQSNNTYTDDLSDVSSHLLKSIIREKNINRFESNPLTKPLTYYSTDKKSYVTAFTPEKMNIVGNLHQESSIPKQSEQSSFPSIVTSKHSRDFSNHSSFNSDQDTSYDSFYDYYDNYQNKHDSNKSDSVTSPFNIFKSSHREGRPQDINSNKSDSATVTSPFNIFKSSHRERIPQDINSNKFYSDVSEVSDVSDVPDVPDVSDVSDVSDASSFNIFKSSHRERIPKDINSILSHYSESESDITF